MCYADKMRRLAINTAILIALISTPVTVAVVGLGYMQVYKTLGMVPFLIACFLGMVTVLGCASIVDNQRSRQTRQSRVL